MKHTTALLPILLVLGAVHAGAQNPPKDQRPKQSEDVVRVTTNLVQLDAIVTDKSGRQIPDLRPEDFELLENGKVRQITQFSYISLTPKEAVADQTNVSQVGKIVPSTTPVPLRPEQVRRAIAIVIDDFGLSFESTANIRSALERFIVEQTLPTDLVAVIPTSGGPGAVQQFTADRRQLLATIKRLRWYSTGRGRVSAVESFSPLDNDENGLYLRGYETNQQLDVSGKEFFHGTLGALGFVIQGLARFPGRKSIVLISDNLPVTGKEALASGVTQAVDNLIELANRHSVVIDTMDARGLGSFGLLADDSQYNLAANQIDKRTRERPMKFRVDQDGLSYLAKQTGGVFIHDTNDLSDGLRRVIDSEQGYYLIAYRPDDLDSETGTGLGRTYKVALRVKRPGLMVRTRSGFHRIELALAKGDAPKTKDQSLRETLSSPFVSKGVHLKMTALFTGRSQVKILLYVDARDMQFTRSAEGTYNGSFDVAAVAFDEKGKVVQQLGRTQNLRVPSDGYQLLLRDGFVYTIAMAMPSAGAYQLRLAFRDSASGRIGSDSQIVELPDAKKTPLTLTGLIVQAVSQEFSKEHSFKPSDVSNAKTIPGSDGDRHYISTGPAVRRFKTGEMLEYSYLIYGARRNGDTHLPKLLSQIRLFRMGKEAFTGSTVPLAIAPEQVGEGIFAGGGLRLGTGLPPGEYFLQVTVTDTLAPADKQSSDQWIDFEIEKK